MKSYENPLKSTSEGSFGGVERRAPALELRRGLRGPRGRALRQLHHAGADVFSPFSNELHHVFKRFNAF